MLLPSRMISKSVVNDTRRNVKMYFGASRKKDVEDIPLRFFMNHRIGLRLFANMKIQYAPFYLDIN